MQLILEKILSRIGKVFISVGDVINQNLTEMEKKKMVKASFSKNAPKVKENFNKKDKMIIPKNVYSHKGSGYKAKGSVNTDSTTFNRARKDIPSGREN
jgi:hypothetical protein